MIPTPGQIVAYTLTALDADQINKRRKDAVDSGICQQNTGAVVHFGNGVSEGDEYPMVIVRCWGETAAAAVNGQVLLDGVDVLWVTSRSQGDGPGQWHEYPRDGSGANR
jgi:hypothetical protein